MDEFNTSFVNNNNDHSHNLTCQVIANSCNILDDIINPEYEDTLYADDSERAEFEYKGVVFSEMKGA